MTTRSPTCRLSVFLSRRTAIGVILRRGPSRWVQMVHWDRGSDRFTPGQWFHGRVYERLCDLSPDGRYFLYFAAKHGRTGRRDNDIGDAWTAVSRPPYFTALGLWPNIGSWYGGGVFKTDRRVQLDATCALAPHPKFKAKHLKVEPMAAKTSPWEQRMLRDGWRLAERGFDPRTFARIGQREVWEKRDPDDAVKLCRQLDDVDFLRFGGPYCEAVWLETGGDLIPIDGAAWADWDTWERLVFVRDGRLFAATLTAAGLQARELYDFNPLQPRQLPPPRWAQQW